mgnify:CR=1 FL=1
MTSISESARGKCFAKFGGRCAYCGNILSYRHDDNQSNIFTLDHFKPKSEGGTNRQENLFPSCLRCNNLKSSFDINVFRQYLAFKISKYQGIISCHQYMMLSQMGVDFNLKKLIFYYEKYNSRKRKLNRNGFIHESSRQ